MKRLLIVVLIVAATMADMKWEQLPSYNNPPPAASQGGLAVIDNKVYVYGGQRPCDKTGPVCATNSTCENVYPDRTDVYDLDTGLWSYQVDNASLVRPSARSTFAYTTYAEKKLFLVYGGVNYQGGSTSSCNVQFRDGLWALNTVTKQWTRLDTPANATNPGPGARVDPTINIYDGELYLFAGFRLPGVHMNDIWKFNFNYKNWTLVNAGGSNSTLYPAPRYHHLAFVDEKNDRLIVVWGDNYPPGNKPQVNDIWQYSFLTNTWQRLDYGTQQANFHPVGGFYKNIVYFAGGDGRPRSYEVEFEEFELDATVTINNVTYPVVVENTEIEAEAEPEYEDPVTKFDSFATNLHYAIDVTPDGALGRRYTMEVHPTVTPGQFKMVAHDQYGNNGRYLIMRGGFRWFCPKFAPRCSIVYLDNVYRFDLKELEL